MTAVPETTSSLWHPLCGTSFKAVCTLQFSDKGEIRHLEYQDSQEKSQVTWDDKELSHMEMKLLGST